mmetsp:Transcript_75380/g.125206  ORF Transcript_75380/g.125206 Transcript_75380/m.125206 type:complete len:327 (+) Transcript_75380:39-1019(+)
MMLRFYFLFVLLYPHFVALRVQFADDDSMKMGCEQYAKDPYAAAPGLCHETRGVLNDGQEAMVMACLADAIYQVDWPDTGQPFGKWGLLARATVPLSHDADHLGVYGRRFEGKDKMVCALAISGTNSLADMQTNLAYGSADILSERCPLFGYKRVHSGYAHKTLAIMDNLSPTGELKQLYEILQDAKLCNGSAYVVGHSKGGALATLLAGCNSWDNKLFKLEKLYTFGAPRISYGDPLAYYQDGKESCFPGYRIFNQNAQFTDVVPTLPPGLVHPLLPVKTWEDDEEHPVIYQCPAREPTLVNRSVQLALHSLRVLIPRLKKPHAD